MSFYIALAIVGGLGSAWMMVHSGSRLTTVTVGPWVTWTGAGRADADPYTRAHAVRLGLLPINATLSLAWHALTDNDGERLRSSCEYSVESDGLDAQWWSLAVFDERGNLIRNSAERYAFNAATALPDPDGGVTITLSRDARPGNWLPTGGVGRITLAFMVQDAKWVATVHDEHNRGRGLPNIRKIGCR
jgi:hypothetical protein